MDRRDVSKIPKGFLSRKTKVTFPVSHRGIRVCALLHSLCPLLPLGIALSSPPLKPLINTVVAVHSPLCARFGSASRNKTSNNKQQQQQQTTTNWPMPSPFPPFLPATRFPHHIVLHPHHSLSPRLRAWQFQSCVTVHVPFFDMCHCLLQLSPLTFNSPRQRVYPLTLSPIVRSIRVFLIPRPSKSVYRNYS